MHKAGKRVFVGRLCIKEKPQWVMKAIPLACNLNVLPGNWITKDLQRGSRETLGLAENLSHPPPTSPHRASKPRMIYAEAISYIAYLHFLACVLYLPCRRGHSYSTEYLLTCKGIFKNSTQECLRIHSNVAHHFPCVHIPCITMIYFHKRKMRQNPALFLASTWKAH